VQKAKLLDYLLKEPGKSKFFRGFGYSEQNWEQLQRDLINIGLAAPKNFRQTTIFGNEYELIGEVIAPNGRKIILKTGWLCAPDDPQTLRFVTAYPA